MQFDEYLTGAINWLPITLETTGLLIALAGMYLPSASESFLKVLEHSGAPEFHAYYGETEEETVPAYLVIAIFIRIILSVCWFLLLWWIMPDWVITVLIVSIIITTIVFIFALFGSSMAFHQVGPGLKDLKIGLIVFPPLAFLFVSYLPFTCIMKTLGFLGRGQILAGFGLVVGAAGLWLEVFT